jgi:hypothetical protein
LLVIHFGLGLYNVQHLDWGEMVFNFVSYIKKYNF